ncbi:MAG: hypothetical protein FWD60_12370 [Candidatus Azobacteroides sp.]|nr:hypothetical protein [Candidatus Azobacteroides sp.]
MAIENIKKYAQDIIFSLEKRKLKDAFDQISFLLSNGQNWQLKEKLNELEQTYKTMLGYVEKGVEDPQLDKIYQDLFRSTYQLMDDVLLQLQTRHTSGFYYDKKRYFKFQDTDADLKQLLLSLDEVVDKQALNSLLEQSNEQSLQLKQEQESLNKQIFNLVWLNDDCNEEDKQLLSYLLSNELIPVSTRSLVITALTLNLQESFDENRMELLLESCNNKKEEIRQRAIIGVLLAFRKYDNRLHLYPGINHLLEHLSEDNSFITSVINVILLFILSKDTEKITKRINEEIIPEMMKLNPILNKKIKLEDLLSESGMEDKNPEWQSFIEEAGLNDKLQEFTELQMSGADVMYSSFAHLKSYSFFNEISSWFLLFSTENSIFFSPSGKLELNEVAEIIFKSSFLCNSDKYSFYMSIMQMPESIRKMMTGQLSAESSALKEINETELPNPEKQAKDIANQYIKDLYRFYKLHPQKRSFQDIFEDYTDFYQVDTINKLISGNKNLQIIGEYYFSKDHYKEAIDIFNKLLESDHNNDVFFQKRAYCKQMTGQLEDALNDYLTAETLNPSNSWIIKKIAFCYRMLKNPENALLYYKKIEQQNPNNLSVQLSIGHCYLELKDYVEALKYYFKIEYLDQKSNKAWRPIAWCSFLAGKYQQSLDYYEKILDNKPEGLDYLNTGHVYLAIKNYQKAIQHYILAVNSLGSFSKFRDSFNGDIQDLITAGIDQTKIPLLLDLVQYDL